MEYQPEELLGIVSRLSEKYTSKESSSVTYENAQMLMEAVVYSTTEGLTRKEYLVAGQLPECEIVYQQGCEVIHEKVLRAKEIYNRILIDFEDYGCRNYHDFILKGIPEFFLRYDSKFAPQDHLLTMDYPTLVNMDSCGIRRILSCLQGVEKEQKFLHAFPSETIKEVLRRIMPEYEKFYMDNICEPILFQAIGCVIAEKTLRELTLDQEDWQEIKEYFAGDDQGQVEQKIRSVIRLLANRLVGEESVDYFTLTAKGYAMRYIALV